MVTFQAIFKQTGIIRVNTLYEMVNSALAFQCHPLPRGRRVGIIATGGGWGVLAADACIKAGLDVVELQRETIDELNSFMPSWWSRANPIDLVAGTFGDDFIRVIEVVMKSPIIDGVILLGMMPALRPIRITVTMTEEDKKHMQNDIETRINVTFDRVAEISKKHNKPMVIASELPATSAAFAQQLNKSLAEKNYVCYSMPHEAATAFATLARYAEYLKQS